MENIRCLIRQQRIPRHLSYPQQVPIVRKNPLLSGSKRKKSSRLMSRDLIWWDPRSRKSEICQTRRSTSVLARASHVRFILTYQCQSCFRVRVSHLQSDQWSNKLLLSTVDRGSQTYMQMPTEAHQEETSQTRSMKAVHLTTLGIRILISARQTWATAYLAIDSLPLGNDNPPRKNSIIFQRTIPLRITTWGQKRSQIKKLIRSKQV